ncbi:hypothetical protein C5167_030977 [Papaver somniferum]|nr:hypothetical protein C5167_030977 [Papaver somniferum]
MNKSQNGGRKSHELPHVAGCISHTGDAALEFIKRGCAVCALDSGVQHNVLGHRIKVSAGCQDMIQLGHRHLQCVKEPPAMVICFELN